MAKRNAVEEELLAAIENHDETSRDVYADWLEQRGDTSRAELVRKQVELDGASTSKALRKLAQGTDAAWRARISLAPVEQCRVQWKFKCPLKWSALEATADATVRFCDSCERNVYYCTTILRAREVAGRGDCVALDLLVARQPNDIGGHRACDKCQCAVTPGLEACPRCNEPMYDEMEMGEVA